MTLRSDCSWVGIGIQTLPRDFVGEHSGRVQSTDGRTTRRYNLALGCPYWNHSRFSGVPTMLTRRKNISVLALLVCVPIAGAMTGSREATAANNPPQPRERSEVDAVLAQAPRSSEEGSLRPIHLVLLADVKDHGPGAHDYPLWQKRWALLIGGRQAESNA